MKYKYCFFLIFICFNLCAQNNAKGQLNTLTITSNSGEQITLSQIESEAMKEIYSDIGAAYAQSKMVKGLKINNTNRIITVNGDEYSYNLEDSMAYIKKDNKLVSTIDLDKSLRIIHNANNDSLNKCPWCVVGVGIALSQGLCALSAGGEHAYCQSTCPCGVESVETTCVAGFRSTKCTCYQCTEDLNLNSLYPGTNGWLTGIPSYINSSGGFVDPWYLGQNDPE